MAYDNEMVEKVRQALVKTDSVQERKMFGSLGFMVNDKLAVCVREHNIMYKLGPDGARKALESKIAGPVIMNGRQSKAWVYIDNQKLVDDGFLRWLEQALLFNTSR